MTKNKHKKPFTIHHSPFSLAPLRLQGHTPRSSAVPFVTKNGFTLVETMILLLILSLAMAATLPIMTKRSNLSAEGLWKYSGSDIYFSPRSAAIGTSTIDNATDNARLLLNTSSDAQSHLMLQEAGTTRAKLVADSHDNVALGDVTLTSDNSKNVALGNGITFDSNGGSIYSNNSVAIGHNAQLLNGSPNSVAIGQGAHADGNGYGSTQGNNIAIGSGSTACDAYSIALDHATAKKSSIAIGSYAAADALESIAIGFGVNNGGGFNTANYAIAIGYNANAKGTGSIAIGGGNTTIYGPYADAVGANAIANYSIAIGSRAQVSDPAYTGSVAIGVDSTGAGASATNSNQIRLGTGSHTVVAPSTLAVTKDSTLKDVSISTGTLTVTGVSTFNSNVSMGGTLTLGLLSAGGVTAIYRNAGGVISTSSDRRLKNVKGEFTGGLDEIKQLKVYNYTFKNDKTKTPFVGVIAQDLQKVFPNAVSKNDKGYLMIRQVDMFYAMVNAIKELDKIAKGIDSKITKTKDELVALIKSSQENNKKLKRLEAKNKELKLRLAKLEKEIGK